MALHVSRGRASYSHSQFSAALTALSHTCRWSLSGLRASCFCAAVPQRPPLYVAHHAGCGGHAGGQRRGRATPVARGQHLLGAPRGAVRQGAEEARRVSTTTAMSSLWKGRRQRKKKRRGGRKKKRSGGRKKERNNRATEVTVIKSPILTTYCMCEEEEERREGEGGGEEEECHVAVTKSPILTPLFWAWVTL